MILIKKRNVGILSVTNKAKKKTNKKRAEEKKEEKTDKTKLSDAGSILGETGIL